MNQDLSSQSVFWQNLRQQLVQTLGHNFSAEELEKLSHKVQLLEPLEGKIFWDSTKAAAGIYLVLAGKVRLLDRHDNLIASLGGGSAFGELTLFPEESFRVYAAKASLKLKLFYLDRDSIRSLIKKYPAIEEHLHKQANLKDLLSICRQTLSLRHVKSEALIEAISLLKPQVWQTGKLPKSVLANQKLWLIREGELLHTSGQKLQAGSIYIHTEAIERDDWLVSIPTEIYSLSSSDWAIAQLSLPQLAASNSPAIDKTSIITRKTMTANVSGLPTSAKVKSKTKFKANFFPSPTQKVNHLWQKATKRYPFFAQQSASDCGVACLVTIGQYWGKRLSVNSLREIARVSRDGSSLGGLVTAAESVGFNTKPVQATLDRLSQQRLPAIAHWEGNHYIVVHEVNKKEVIVADPAIGQRNLTHSEFNKGWTGYALLLEPTVLLKEAEEAKTPFWNFLSLLKPHSLVMSEILITSILIQLFGLITPLFTQLLLDRVIVQGSTTTLNAVGVGLLVFGMFKVAMTGLRQYLLDHTANKVDLALIVGFIRHAFRLPLDFFETRYVGDIIARVQENRKIQNFLTGEALSIFLDLLTVFVYVGLMLWYSWKMALLTLTIVPPFLLLALLGTPFLQRISREIFTTYAKENSYLIEALTGIRTVKSMAVEQKVRWHWEELLNKATKTTFSGQVIGNQFQILSSTIQTLISTVLLWFGASQVIQGQLTIGQLVAFNMLLNNVITPFQRLTVLWNQLQEVIIAIERINDVVEAEPEEDLQTQSRQVLSSIRGHICFDRVTFRYHADGSKNILESLSFEIQPGQMVALVGRSGSGKTTISKLMLGLYLPTEGKILIDGKEIDRLALQSLRQHIGVVDQNNFLFSGTIRENITITHPEATLAEIKEAAIQAGAHDFIEQMPMSYESQIGEGGGLLSGGQRQRLAIARALLGNPRLLILDEATSSLDAESERIIQNNLNTILRDRTTVVIAHRLSTVRKADLILVLDRGILVESGTHDSLMAERGHYFYLNHQQLAVVE